MRRRLLSVLALITVLLTLAARTPALGSARLPAEAYLPFIARQEPTTPTPTPYLPDGTWSRYRMTYSIALTQYTGQTKVWMPVPTEWGTQRDVQILGYHPAPYEVFTEPQGNKIVFWETQLEGGGPHSFSEQFEVSCLDARWQIDPQAVGVYDPLDPILASYLGSSEYIQADHQEIQNAARDVVGSETNPYVKASLLFDFVVERMNGFSPGINDALGAYRARRGECGGYSHLFIALCRAVGVPARPVTGIGGVRQGEHHWASGEVGTHVWAEFYLPDYGWVPADPIVKDLNGLDTLGTSYGNRLILSKGSDIELGHGLDRAIPWFHMPYVNGHQEEGEDLVLEVDVLSD